MGVVVKGTAKSCGLVCGCCDSVMGCLIEDASPDRGERPSGAISGVAVHERDYRGCIHLFICFAILSVRVGTGEDPVPVYLSSR